MAGLDMTMKVKSAEYRPCEVGGRKALFHRWIPVNKIGIKCIQRYKDAEKANELFRLAKEELIFHLGMHPIIVENVYGLVEYENGTMDKVDPEKIVFKDSERKFKEEQ